jgi:hypothetical protein
MFMKYHHLPSGGTTLKGNWMNYFSTGAEISVLIVMKLFVEMPSVTGCDWLSQGCDNNIQANSLCLQRVTYCLVGLHQIME